MTVRMDSKNYEFMREAGMACVHFELCYTKNLMHEEDRGIDCYKNLEKIDWNLAMKVIKYYTEARKGPFSTEYKWGRAAMIDTSINSGGADNKAKAFRVFFEHYGFSPYDAIPFWRDQLTHPIYADETLAHVPLRNYATCFVVETDEVLLGVGLAVGGVAACFLAHQGGLAAIDKEGFFRDTNSAMDNKLSSAFDAVKEGGLALGSAKAGDMESAYEHMVEAGRNIWESFTTPMPNPGDYAQ